MYSIRVTDAPWNVVMDGTTDNTAALAALSAHIAGLYAAGARLPRIIFPEGVCAYTAFPDFAFPGLHIGGESYQTYLRNLGNDHAVNLAGEVRPYFVRNMTFGPFTIEGGRDSKSSLRINQVHTSHIDVASHGCGTNYPAFSTLFCVLTHFKLRASVNDWPMGWFDGPLSQPKRGIDIDWSGGPVAAERNSGCVYFEPIIEGIDRGIYIGSADGAKIIRGTSEACYDWGVFISPNAQECEINGLWCEANGASGGGDIYVQGRANQVILCKTTKLVKFENSNNCVINSGNHHNIVAAPSAINTREVRPLFYTGSKTGAFIY